MSMRYHINRPRGNLLPAKTDPEPPPPLETKIIDIDHYNKTGECLTPEEVRQLKEKEVVEMQVANKPTKEQLAEDLKTMTISELAKKYKCGNSTVSYWINQWGMQRKPVGQDKQKEARKVEDKKNLPVPDNQIQKPACFGNGKDDITRLCNLCGFFKECKPELAEKVKEAGNSGTKLPVDSITKSADKPEITKLIDTPWDDLKVMLLLVRENYHDHAEKAYHEAARKLNEEYHDKAEKDFRRDMEKLLEELGLGKE